ncbi:MAG: sugar phosphate isomerase/epimerase [Candidatus Poribacteria bacterium]|nr:sugar phosphate isomerase/epimerase [Candidatus Poribacteria bacterium]
MKHTIGCTTRPYASLTFAEACEQITAAGYTDVAVFATAGKVPVRADSTAAEVASSRQIAADAGLTPSMLIGSTKLNLGLEEAVEDYRRLIDNAAALGTKWLLDCGTGNDAHYADYFELMRRTVPHAASAGVNITLKPHGGMTLTIADLIKAYDEVNHPAFGLCYDPGNIIYYTKGELRPETDVASVASRVTTAIIKDCVVENGKPDVMVTPGDGLVDFEKVLGRLVAGGFDGPLYVECVGGTTLDEINQNVGATLRFVGDILAEA